MDDREGGAAAPYRVQQPQDETTGREAIQQKVDSLGAYGRRGFCAASARERTQRHRFACAEEEPLALDAVTAPAIAVACFITFSHLLARRDHMYRSPRSYVLFAETISVT